ncbi:MAG: RND family transporter [Candidatus Omnitrophica bacterium]|nr:RND family transporter [Candidatus Omnitrophota bacterium]
MKRIVDRFILFPLKYPWLVLSLVSIITIGTLFFVPKIKLDNSVDVFFDKKSGSYINFQEWKEQFGSDDIVIVAFKDNDIFTSDNLRLIERLTEKFESLKYVDNVVSLTNVNDIIGEKDDFIVELLIEDIPEEIEGLTELKNRALANPLYVKNVISENGKTTAFIVELVKTEGLGEDDYKKNTVSSVYKILDDEIGKSKEYFISGRTATEYFYTSYMQRDLITFIPLMFFIIVVMLFFAFRDKVKVFLSLGVIVVSFLWTMAFLYFCGYTINNMSAIIPPIIIAIAIADTMHLIAVFSHLKNNKRGNSIEQSLKEIVKPCFLTSITTVAGFLSLTVSKVPAVRELGIVVAVGISFAFVITFMFLPALIKIFNLFSKTDQSQDKPLRVKSVCSIKESGDTEVGADSNLVGNWLDGFLAGIFKFNEKFKFLVIGLTIVLSVFSFFGLTKIKVETSILEFFKKNSPVHKGTLFIQENLSGVHFVYVSIKSEQKDYFKDPKTLQSLENLQNYLISLPEVDKTTSVVDYMKEINKSFNQEDSNYYKIPSSKNMIAQYLLLYGAEDLNDYVDSNWQWVTVRIRLNEHSTVKSQKVLLNIRNYLSDNFSNNLKVGCVGQTILDVEANDTVSQGQIKSLSLALVLIFGMMFFVFKSLRLGLISIVPNILPLLVNFGIMGYLGIRLNSATSMISAIGIGIIVDDTIHFLHEFGENLKGKGDYFLAMNKTLKAKGRPILLTSIVLFFGFGVLYFSKFVPTSSFGLLSALLMVNALWADLFILPCLLIVLKPKFKR